MDRLVICLVYFCSLSVSFLDSHEHDHRPNRLDTDPDMDLKPMTRYWHSFTTPRPMTLRDPILLPGMPHETRDPEDYEYYNYEDYGHHMDDAMTSSGHIDYHVETSTHVEEEEYVYTDAGASNAQNEFFMNSASRFSSWSWISLFGTALSLLLI